MIAKAKSGVNDAQVGAAAAACGFRIRSSVALVPGLVVLEDSTCCGPLARSAAAPLTPRNWLRRLHALAQTGRFEFVEPDVILSAARTPSDAAFVNGACWGLRNDGGYGGVSGADIGATAAWDLTIGAPDVIVAVLDTGIRFTHQDLAARMWRNPGEIPDNGLDDDRNGYVDDVHGFNAITGAGDPTDDEGHGTHIAGILGAAANDGHPHVGVAWETGIMACKFLDAEGRGTTSDAIEAIQYALAHGAAILNASWGSDLYSEALFQVLAAAEQRVFIAAAAGNGGSDNDQFPHYPAAYRLNNLVAVAALNRKDKLSSFSNFGRESVDLAAPGEQIYSTYNGSDSDYALLDGTSMAAPYVAGVAALGLARFPSAQPLEIQQRLLTSVVPFSGGEGKTVAGGRLNAWGALVSEEDGILEVQIRPSPGTALTAGKVADLRVTVTDLVPLPNANVVAVLESGECLALLDGGTEADDVAGDATFCGAVPVPEQAAQLRLQVVVQAPSKETRILQRTYPVVRMPANDDFADSLWLLESQHTETGSNVGATREEAEPRHTLRSAGGCSVWWSWRAPEDGLLDLDTDGSSFDTLLAVYTGDAIGTLTQVASDDDHGEGSCSRLMLEVRSGQVFHIAVDGFSGSSGTISLHLGLSAPPGPPANDDFVNAVALAGLSARVSGLNVAASRQAGEPDHAGQPGGCSVWWRWTAPADGTASVRTDGSSFDTLLAVYTGSQLDDLVPVAADDESGQSSCSALEFAARLGDVYWIVVDGYAGASGSVVLELKLEAHVEPPPNDAWVAASRIDVTPARLVGSNAGATREPDEPDHAANTGGRSVWWSWTAPGPGRLSLTTLGSDFDTVLAVYLGAAPGQLLEQASNHRDAAGTAASRVDLEVKGGFTYTIAVDGHNQGLGPDEGQIVLNVDFGPQPVPSTNDAFANRPWLAEAGTRVQVFSGEATRELFEPVHANKPGGRSLWWQWTPPASGSATLSTSGSDFDTLLAVYRGVTLESLILVAADDDSGPGLTSGLALPVRAGEVYQIALDGYRGAAGLAEFELVFTPSPEPPLNDDAARAILLADPFQTEHGSNMGATREPGEDLLVNGARGRSVWWCWCPSNSVVATLDTQGSDFDTVLGVFQGAALEHLVPLVVNNDFGPDDSWSQVLFEAIAGETYWIAVDSMDTAGGAIVLNLAITSVRLAVIEQQPSSQKAHAGEVVAFSVRATALTPCTYQWSRDGSALVDDAMHVYGATTGQLLLLDVGAVDIGAYRVAVGNAAGWVSSREADLQVDLPFRFVTSGSVHSGSPGWVMSLGGRVAETYRLEMSEDLVTWLQWGTVSNTDGLIRLIEPFDSGLPRRFYRAAVVSEGVPPDADAGGP